MIGPDIHEAGVAPDIVNAIGIGPGHGGPGKVMPLHLPRLFLRAPLLADIGVIADELFPLVSTEITGQPHAKYRFTAALMWRNCASRSGWSSPSSVSGCPAGCSPDRGESEPLWCDLTGCLRRVKASAMARVLLHAQRSGDSGSPRVCSSIIASSMLTSRGSDA